MSDDAASQALVPLREVYANWFLWAQQNLTKDKRRCHAAAQIAVQAMRDGADADRASSLARQRFSDGSVVRAVDSWDPMERKYAEWYSWTVQVEGADTQTGHKAASAALAALKEGKSQAEATDRARLFILAPDEARLVAAARLLEYLQAGGNLSPVENAYFHLHAGEYIVASVPGHRLEFFGTTETYNAGWFMAFGNPILTLATIGGSLAINAAKKSAAQARARERWRLVDSGTLHVTNLRLAFQGEREWFDIPYEYIRASGCFEDTIEVALDGRYPLRLQVSGPEYCFVAMRWLSGQKVAVEVPPELKEKAKNIGAW